MSLPTGSNLKCIGIDWILMRMGSKSPDDEARARNLYFSNRLHIDTHTHSLKILVCLTKTHFLCVSARQVNFGKYTRPSNCFYPGTRQRLCSDKPKQTQTHAKYVWRGYICVSESNICTYTDSPMYIHLIALKAFLLLWEHLSESRKSVQVVERVWEPPTYGITDAENRALFGTQQMGRLLLCTAASITPTMHNTPYVHT